MRITNNMLTNGLLSEIQNLNSQQDTLQGEVSSGLAVAQPSDDPSAFGQVVQLQSQDRQLTQFASNASRALDLANSSYSGLTSLQSLYDRATQLGALGMSTNGTQSTQAYASEMDQLVQQAVQVANSQLGGQYLYGGTANSTAPFTTTTDSTGQITGVSYVGNSDQAAIPLSSTSSVAPGTSGTTNQGMADLINHLIAVRDALAAGDTNALSTANQNLTPDEDTITSAVAENGAIQSRIQAEQTQQQSQTTELDSLISGATSADLPSTMVKLNQAQLAYQAALQTAASVMHMSILNYINLG